MPAFNKKSMKSKRRKTGRKNSITLFHTVVDQIAQLFARLEMGNELGLQLDGITCFWIAPDTGGTEVQGETAKTTNFYTLTFRQRLSHQINNRLYRQLDIFD